MKPTYTADIEVRYTDQFYSKGVSLDEVELKFREVAEEFDIKADSVDLIIYDGDGKELRRVIVADFGGDE